MTPDLTDGAWTFARNEVEIAIHRERVGDEVALVIASEGSRRTYVFVDVHAVIHFQSMMEAYLLATGWSLILWSDHLAWGGMFAAMSCATSALAATLQIRCYVVRMMCVVRAAGRLDAGGGFDRPRPVRDF